jgi:hypothetical protein
MLNIRGLAVAQRNARQDVLNILLHKIGAAG